MIWQDSLEAFYTSESGEDPKVKALTSKNRALGGGMVRDVVEKAKI